ncbi:MAG TPA: OmpA family protein [Saprospiraceae bacterium]|nr:OmpA family protein [Saprospiraceae bacterium]HMV22965.1 OmpA family protein [Saprospiraceae bacterium]HMX82655.1 OmpA family protein [Saprospiraceae bacterium]HMX84946.1 OmpA family protein [Saprospiraceae bacterium]HMZ74194.1 OmpA family protein [Saprospiraceae bacterium]
MKKVLFGFLLIGLMTSCVSKKKFTALQSEKDQLMQMLENNKKLLADCNDEKAKLTADLSAKGQEAANATKQIKSLEDQIASLNNNNTNLLKRLEDLSIISQAGAESIKKSLDAMNEKDKYIKNLTSSMARKDSLNLALVMNLKKSLADVNDTDVQIEVKKGVVYISISDKMLFQSGSSMINASAQNVLAKVAKVLNDHKDLDILVEGHTDNVPISTEDIKDNWDLSAKRATAVVRTLQNKYKVDPSRLTAGGRSEYSPKTSNATTEGKKLNRRTEIIILPKLDQFFQMLAPSK